MHAIKTPTSNDHGNIFVRDSWAVGEMLSLTVHTESGSEYFWSRQGDTAVFSRVNGDGKDSRMFIRNATMPGLVNMPTGMAVLVESVDDTRKFIRTSAIVSAVWYLLRDGSVTRVEW